MSAREIKRLTSVRNYELGVRFDSLIQNGMRNGGVVQQGFAFGVAPGG